MGTFFFKVTRGWRILPLPWSLARLDKGVAGNGSFSHVFPCSFFSFGGIEGPVAPKGTSSSTIIITPPDMGGRISIATRAGVTGGGNNSFTAEEVIAAGNSFDDLSPLTSQLWREETYLMAEEGEVFFALLTFLFLPLQASHNRSKSRTSCPPLREEMHQEDTLEVRKAKWSSMVAVKIFILKRKCVFSKQIISYCTKRSYQLIYYT